MCIFLSLCYWSVHCRCQTISGLQIFKFDYCIKHETILLLAVKCPIFGRPLQSLVTVIFVLSTVLL